MRLDVRAATRRFVAPPVTRFAPSTTGYLHLGHVANAIYVWGVARALGGRVILRVEDHDRIRARPEFEAAILEDLDWLGFAPDEGRRPVLRQSDTPEVYRSALDDLRRNHHVYACACSRTRIGGERYDGYCRERGLADSPRRGVRIRIDGASETFDDLLRGPIVQVPAEQCGDILLRDRDANWTYQLAVVVDDLRQGVTLVVRGEDLLSSTGRQIALGRMLGRSEPPAFLHHPLILDATGEKLSKSQRHTGVRALRASGVSAPDVIGRAAAAVGLVPSERPISAEDVARLFV